MNYQPNVNEITENLEGTLARYFGCTSKEATREQMYKAAAITVKNILSDKRSIYKKKVNQAGGKRVYYMCMEFLLGRSLKTNLHNLGLANAYEKALKKLGFGFKDAEYKKEGKRKHHKNEIIEPRRRRKKHRSHKVGNRYRPTNKHSYNQEINCGK